MDVADVMVKICPACNEENPISEVICRVCMTNLTSVSPTQKKAKEVLAPAAGPEKAPDADGGRTICSPLPAVLSLSRPSDGRALPVADGSVLGRSGESGAFFEKDRTVSRSHAKIHFNGDIWSIEDLNSTNGTWVNGKRLTPAHPSPIRVGDSIALSMACELKVIA